MPMLEGKIDARHRGRHPPRQPRRRHAGPQRRGASPQLEVPSDQAGYAQLLGLVAERAPGRRCWALEGTGCYGAGLASFLARPGRVGGRDRPAQAARGRTRRQERPAGRHPGRPGGTEPRPPDQPTPARPARGAASAAATRAGAVKARADARRHLKALLVTAPEPLRAGCGGGPGGGRPGRARRWRPAADPVEHRATVRALRPDRRAGPGRPAGGQRSSQGAAHARPAMAPALLAQPGVGPITAAQLLISWSHPGRLRSEAAFAMLAGVAPIPASSGQVVRHRLNRGGDRQLNRALHTIVMLREALPRANQALCGPPHRRGQEPTRDPPLPQARPRPRAVSAAGAQTRTPSRYRTARPAINPLTTIEASLACFASRSIARVAALATGSDSASPRCSQVREHQPLTWQCCTHPHPARGSCGHEPTTRSRQCRTTARRSDVHPYRVMCGQQRPV